MISQTAEYALRAIVTLAQKPGEPILTPRIASQTKVPAAYLAKILRLLAKGGIVTSQRGLGGGYTLARDPTKVTVLEVINVVDPLKRIERCPLKIGAHNADLCPLHKRLDEAVALVERTFAETAIADLLAPVGRTAALCQSSKEQEREA